MPLDFKQEAYIIIIIIKISLSVTGKVLTLIITEYEIFNPNTYCSSRLFSLWGLLL